MTSRTKTFYPLDAILEYLGDREDARLTEQRLIAVRERRTKTIPLEALMKTNGLMD